MFWLSLVSIAITIFWIGYITVTCAEKWRGRDCYAEIVEED